MVNLKGPRLHREAVLELRPQPPKASAIEPKVDLPRQPDFSRPAGVEAEVLGEEVLEARGDPVLVRVHDFPLV